LTPPGPTFFSAMFRVGLATLQTYTCVSSEPDAQCFESEVHVSELTRAEWKDQRAVMSYAGNEFSFELTTRRNDANTYLLLLDVE
jgi:hypothetical protein